MMAQSLKCLLLAGFVLVWQVGAAREVESQMLDAGGVKIHYLVAGAGEPVVLIHGLYSSAQINWQLSGNLAALAADHQVVALDLPGFGRSDKPAAADAYGLQWIEDIALLLDHLNIRRAHVVGYSMGGIVALKFIAEHPDRVLSGTLGGMGWLREAGGLQQIWKHLRDPAARGVARLALAKSELQAIKVPVVILIGDRDPIRGLYVTPLQAVRTDWPVVEIKDAGHLNCIFKRQFIAEIVKWVDMNRSR
jgi:pimeloyl-ACP methyl ester carboxylesterase